ncbi:7436_t:CDS:2 [Ambispora leptoticha]|uniref:ATP synthase subunit delta, mitochondrial n=1 Tax=Ambispora leptoticha TaxID=144679 RepID=A0A9N8V497_9GLOM|nr:7436_t:CDS:2 [Ambispora leptoticha]
MNILARTVRAATFASGKPLASVRFYAQEATAPSNILRLNFALPHQTLYRNVDVQQVNLSSTSGDMGILANHVPSIEQLRPGVIEIIENPNTTQKYFVSGGFAIVHPNSSLDINAIEAFSLDDFSIESIKTNLAEAQRIAASSASEEEKAVASIEAEVYENLQKALTKSA